ncbi:MAG: 2-C-methyl-D-erythritol 2,4-cyclodiphosphate synthase [Defluviitaleaceae bacterium]|nr:2-C-methyl-D-erythritol 2,4-cyclodiphosphate synthase [Defluviitaleaceae bacterium]
MRIGHSKDVHRLVPNRPLILGGVEINHHLGLDGHSDADVLTHVVIESIMGALALGDIGTHFPDTDPAYKGAHSMDLLAATKKMLDTSGYRIGNLDATIYAEQPKMQPHIDKMRQNIADVLAINLTQVNVKATRGEGMGFVGRCEGMGAECVVLLMERE